MCSMTLEVTLVCLITGFLVGGGGIDDYSSMKKVFREFCIVSDSLCGCFVFVSRKQIPERQKKKLDGTGLLSFGFGL